VVSLSPLLLYLFRMIPKYTLNMDWVGPCRYGLFNLYGLLIGTTTEGIYEEGEGPQGNFYMLQCV
jgi:hypothetical protein